MNKPMKNGIKQGAEFPAGSERREYVLPPSETLLELSEMVWYPPYGQDTNHHHNCMEIGLCLTGSGTITMGQRAYDFSAGTVVIVPAGLHHSQQNRGEPLTHWRYVALDEQRFLTEIPAKCRVEVMRFLQQRRLGGLYLNGGVAHEDILGLLQRMFDAHIHYAGEARGEIEALLLLLLVRAAREPIQKEMNATIDPLSLKSIEPALLFVSENYQHEIRVQQMARACAMSESHFRRVFGQLMSLSPAEYVNRYRVHRAMHLLHVTGHSVQQVALECGFPAVSTFVRNFVRYAGQNPSAWRRHHAAGIQKTEPDSVENAEYER